MGREELEEKLESGLKELNIKLDKEKINQLIEYIFILKKWNKVYNLTAIRDIEQMMTHHLMDSLSIIPWVKDCKKILDVGSGGGLPGLVIAVSCPQVMVEMIDVVSKKTSFIRQAVIELGLKNTKVHTGRVEDLQLDYRFDGIVSRAFSSIKDFIALSSHLLAENGSFYAMKGLIPESEVSNLDTRWKVKDTIALSVPYLAAQRHLIIIQRNKVIL